MASLLGSVSDEVVPLLIEIIEMRRNGCYDSQRVFDALYGHIKKTEIETYMGDLVDNLLAWEYPGSEVRSFGNAELSAKAQRILDFELSDSEYPAEPPLDQASFEVDATADYGCVNYAITQTPEPLIDNHLQSIDFAKFKEKIAEADLINVHISTPCTINKWGEFEFNDRAIWGKGELLP
jgi:hypothetical protein